MTDQTNTNTANTQDQTKVKSAKYNVTNPTRADHVINTVGGHKRIPAGTVVENVEIADTEAKAMKELHKKAGEGQFVKLDSASGGDDSKTERLPDDKLAKDPLPGDQLSKDKLPDPSKDPLPSQDPHNRDRKNRQ
jgi:hypothetical protein